MYVCVFVEISALLFLPTFPGCFKIPCESCSYASID